MMPESLTNVRWLWPNKSQNAVSSKSAFSSLGEIMIRP